MDTISSYNFYDSDNAYHFYMEQMILNLEKAQKIGAFQHDKLLNIVKAGDIIINCYTMEVTKFTLPKEIRDFAKQKVKKGTYYVKALPEQRKIFINLLRDQEAVKEAKERYETLKTISDESKSKMHEFLYSGFTSIIASYIKVPLSVDLSAEDIKLLDKQRILKLGRKHRDGDNNLWVAIIAIDGYLTEKLSATLMEKNKHLVISFDAMHRGKIKYDDESFAKFCEYVKL